MNSDELTTRIDDIEQELNRNMRTIKQITIVCMVIVLGILIELGFLSFNAYYMNRPVNMTTICNCSNYLDEMVDTVVDNTNYLYSNYAPDSFLNSPLSSLYSR